MSARNPKLSRTLFAQWLVAYGIVLVLGCTRDHETVLYVRDEVCRPGESVTVSAKLEENNWRWEDVEGKPVSLWHVAPDGRRDLMDHGTTDSEGYFSASFHPPAEGMYTIEASFSGAPRFRPSSFRSAVFCLPATRFGIILDIDKTIAATTIRDILSGRFRLAPPLDSNTVRVVNALAKEYDLFIVTSRPRTQAGVVLEWLERNGFPRAPTFFYDPRREAIRPAAAKRVVTQELKKKFPRIAVGLGDRDSDLKGYMQEGLLAIGVRERERGTFYVRSWSDVEDLLLGDKGPQRLPATLTIHRPTGPMSFRLIRSDEGYQLEHCPRNGVVRTTDAAPWREQLSRMLHLITAPEGAIPADPR